MNLSITWSLDQNFTWMYIYTGSFVSSSGISELDCATTKTDTAERSISIDRESLRVFYVLGAVAYLHVSPLGGQSWRNMAWTGNKKESGLCLGICQNLTSVASPTMQILSTCKVGQKLAVSVPLLTCCPSVWPSRLLYRRGRKSRRDLWITLYIWVCIEMRMDDKLASVNFILQAFEAVAVIAWSDEV
jgi:hypothetical protein